MEADGRALFVLSARHYDISSVVTVGFVRTESFRQLTATTGLTMGTRTAALRDEMIPRLVIPFVMIWTM
jgi:hypothetical protein